VTNCVEPQGGHLCRTTKWTLVKNHKVATCEEPQGGHLCKMTKRVSVLKHQEELVKIGTYSKLQPLKGMHIIK
jgi:hypothetical protein